MKTNLIFIHGFLGSSMNWSRVVSLLKSNNKLKNVEYHCFDLLWHSKNYISLMPSDGQFLKMLVDDLKTKIEAMDGTSIVVAHSFGLRPLLEFVATSLEPKLPVWIVEDSAPALSAHGYMFLSDILRQTPIPFQNRKDAANYFDTQFPDDKSLTQFLLSNIADKTPGQWTWRFNDKALAGLLDEVQQSPRWDSWEAYTGQIYLLYGGNSKVLTPQVLKKCIETRGSRHLETVLFEDSEHWLHFDNLDRFVLELERIVLSLN